MTDEAKGKAEHLGGRIKEGVGDALGDSELRDKGRLDQQKGEARQDEARAEEKAKEARDRRLDAEVEKESRDD